MDLSKAYLEQELQSVRNQGAQARANISALEEQLAKQRSDAEQIKGAEKALLMMLQRVLQTPVTQPQGEGQEEPVTPANATGLLNGAAPEETVS